MTLILIVQGRRSIWAAADGRLSYAKGTRKPRDEEMKLVSIDATDGNILLAYAGLGATARGSTVSDWVRLAFRGTHGTVEGTLAAVGSLAQQEFQRHLAQLPPAFAQHTFLATAVVDGEVRAYTIGLSLSPDRTRVEASFNRPLVTHGRPPRIIASGSGIGPLFSTRTWIRPILRLVAAHEAGKVTGRLVADQIGRVIYGVHLRDKTVGPNSVVVWRYADAGGGEHQYHKSANRHDGWAPIPTLARGMDVNQIVEVTMKHAQASFDALRAGQPDPIDSEQINAELRALDWERRPSLR